MPFQRNILSLKTGNVSQCLKKESKFIDNIYEAKIYKLIKTHNNSAALNLISKYFTVYILQYYMFIF